MQEAVIANSGKHRLRFLIEGGEGNLAEVSIAGFFGGARCYWGKVEDGSSMKTLSSSGGVVVICVALVAMGCAKKETVTSADKAAADAAAATKPTAARIDATKDTLATKAADAKSMLANFKLPDLSATSGADLASMSTKSLTNLAEAHPEVAKEADAVKESISANKATDALSRLSPLAESAKSIPGAPVVIEGVKKMVSAWALKQGFDTAMIAPVLGALQSGDYAALATQGATLLGSGGVTDQQKGLLNGVMGAFGIEAGGLMDKAKKLF